MKKTVHGSRFTVYGQKGSALLITLLVVTILVSLTVEFAYDVYVNTSALSNWTNAQKASLTAKSGQTLSTTYLKEMGRLPFTYQTDINLPVEEDFGPDINLTIKIEDENSKFNINNLVNQRGETNKDVLSSLQKLFEYLNINPSLALAIADYIDSDQEPQLRDSEDNAKNSELWSIDELKLIKGMDKKTFETIKPYVTVYGEDKTTETFPININTAKLPVLMSLHKDMKETLAKQIIDYRENTPFDEPGQICNISWMSSSSSSICVDIQNKISVKGFDFRIITTANVYGITRIIESVMDTSMNIKFWREG